MGAFAYLDGPSVMGQDAEQVFVGRIVAGGQDEVIRCARQELRMTVEFGLFLLGVTIGAPQMGHRSAVDTRVPHIGQHPGETKRAPSFPWHFPHWVQK